MATMGIKAPSPPPNAKVRCSLCDGKGYTKTFFRRRKLCCRQCLGHGYGIAKYISDGFWPTRQTLEIVYLTKENANN